MLVFSMALGGEFDGRSKRQNKHPNTGWPAKMLLELKRRGLVGSNREAISQGILALYEKVLQRDLATEQLNTIRRALGDEG